MPLYLFNVFRWNYGQVSLKSITLRTPAHVTLVVAVHFTFSGHNWYYRVGGLKIGLWKGPVWTSLEFFSPPHVCKESRATLACLYRTSGRFLPAATHIC